MGLLRWIAARGARVTMAIALFVFAYHVTNELRVLFGRPPNFHQRLELTALDVKFDARGARPPADGWKVAIAAIDEKALQTYGVLPWSRTVYADLVTKLTEAGAASIAFDMTFDHPAPSGAAEAVRTVARDAAELGLFEAGKATARAAETTSGVARSLEKVEPRPLRAKVGGFVAPLDEAAAGAARASQVIAAFEGKLGERAATVDPDEAFAAALTRSERTVLGVINLSKLEAESTGLDGVTLKRSLALVASSTISELVTKGSGGVDQIHSDVAETFETGLFVRFFGVQAPTEKLAAATPHFATINALPDDDGVYRRVALVSSVKGSGVLLPTLALKAVEVAVGDFVQVVGEPGSPSPEAVQVGPLRADTELGGSTTLDWYGHFRPDELPIFSVADLISGKIDPAQIQGRIFFVAATAAGTHDQRVTPMERAVPGVYIHATLAQNLLDGRHMARPQYVIVLELVLFLFVGLVAGLVMTKQNVVGQVLTAFAMAAVWLAVDQLVLFERGIVVYTVLPVFQIFLTLLAVALWRFLVEQREREKTRRAFGQYLAPAVMEQVLTHPEEYLKLGGRRYEATVLFSDIRGFTTISEALSPEELGTLLNRYMTPMTDLVFAHGGTLDKYIGDAVMAFWGAPIEQSDHALRACRTALDMIAKVAELNKEFEAAGLPRIAIGIGLSSGPMTIGNMGSDDHFSYTALGDRVNLGARLEGQTKDYGVDILISDACFQLVKDVMLCRELGALRVKGKFEPVKIYELVGERSKSEHRVAFVETFHESLALYRAQRWDDAIAGFTRARALAGPHGDKCSDHYITWCSEYQQTPPPPGWDGVRVATSK
ncbi:adenylate/guanylate cyclase domain-containing protein [Myxococcota bacterium]|nr:adenylate/guanylate cyclase domain-containing protein [Myxococcota bacterium]